MKLLAVTLAALALTALPADVSPAGSARANVCDVEDLECHEEKARCHLAPVLEGEWRACPR
jgi:hypothetical protein